MNWTDFIIAIKQGLIPSKKELVDGTTTVGNANTVDGYHAYQLQALGSDGNPFGHYVTVKHDAFNRFKFENNANLQTSVDHATNAEQLGGKGASEYASIETLTKMGLKDTKLSATKWSEIQKTWNLETTFFTAWGDGGGEMPTDWGGGIIIPALDASCKFIIYVGMISNTPYRIWLGYMKFSDHTTYTIQWSENATTADLANYLPLGGGEINGLLKILRDATVGMEINSVNSLVNLINFQNLNGTLGYLGFARKDNPCVYGSNGQLAGYILHSGNVGYYAVPKTGGEITTDGISTYLPQVTLTLKNGVNDGGAMVRFDDAKGFLGFLGFENVHTPIFSDSNGNPYPLHHDGNSAKVAIQSTAPTDTSALWVW